METRTMIYKNASIIDYHDVRHVVKLLFPSLIYLI